MKKVDKKLASLVVIIGILLLSLTFVSAFNLGDWLRGLFGANKITGYDILEGRLTSYSFDSVIGNNVVIANEGVGGKSGNFSGNGYVSMPLSEFPAYPSSGSTLVTWTDNSNNENHFEVQKELCNGVWLNIAVGVSANTQQYSDTSGITGNYRVRACYNSACSDYSQPVAIC